VEVRSTWVPVNGIIGDQPWFILREKSATAWRAWCLDPDYTDNSGSFCERKVRLLILSDIHSNLEALEACLDAVDGWDQFVNLGDTVGYGADPNAVIGRVRPLGGLSVRGNHDRAVLDAKAIESFNPIAAQAMQWTRNSLAPENLEWLGEVQTGPCYEPSLAGTQFVHGSPVDEDEYILSEFSARTAFANSSAQLIFFGHTHIQVAVEYKDGEIQVIHPSYAFKRGSVERCDLPLENGARYLVNPGSVGQPRDGDWRAGFAIYESSSRQVSFWRTPYDVDLTQQKIIGAGLPFRLASRLREGR
jgi:predicted phosphodiesterase